MTAQQDSARRPPIPPPLSRPPAPDFMERIERAKEVREAARKAHDSAAEKDRDASNRLGFLAR